MSVVIVGLGYVGLPLAQEAVRVGHSVTGLDIRQATIDSRNAGRSHIDDLADEDVAAMVAVGFRATTSVADIARHDVGQPPPPGLLDELAQGADPARVPQPHYVLAAVISALGKRGVPNPEETAMRLLPGTGLP